MTKNNDAPGEELATRLLALRVTTGLNGKEFAQQLGWAPSKVSRLENGHQRPSHDDLHKWAASCGVPEQADQLVNLLEELRATHRAWRRRARAGHAAIQADYNRLVAQCVAVDEFEIVFVPGLLQTPAYARHIFAEMKKLHDLDTDDVEKAVAARLERQRYIYDDAKRFRFLIAEPVLRWGVCPAEVMLPQLDRLLTAAALPNVELAILPLGRPLTITPQNSFVLYDDVAIVESFTAETVCGDEESQRYRRIMDVLWADAAAGDSAVEIIHEAMSRLKQSI